MPRRKETKSGPTTLTNSDVARLLRDYGAAQPSRQSRFGYARAAETVAALPAPIQSYVMPDGTLRKIANIGPSSTRAILEILRTGTPPEVDAQAAASTAIERDKTRGTFLTQEDIQAALKNRRLKAVSLDDYRGDLQMHSTFSDGRQTLEAIVTTGIARGYEYAAVTDHYGLPVAHGVTMTRLAEQHQEIDRLNKVHGKRFRIIKGIEANILGDGSIDMSREQRREVELVVAAPHSGLRSSEDQTRRMLKVVRTPGVHILGHPRGRKHGVRPGLEADWDRIFTAAASATVAIEIDGDPRRQDIDHELARRALDIGCIFALDSDAHAASEWAFADNAVAHARLAGIPAERVINTWPLDFLLKWAASLNG